MLSSAPALALSLFNHHTDNHYQTLVREKVVDRARHLARLEREKGPRALKASEPLVQILMETENGRVGRSGLGVLDLSWQAAEHPEWPEAIQQETEQIRTSLQAAQGVELDHLIWVGMGGSAEDKHMYNALGLLDGGVRVHVLDSTDPAKLEAILARLTSRGARLDQVLRRTLVMGMALGMTSYEPVLNLEKLRVLFDRRRIPTEPNFMYMTLPGSELERFAAPRGYRRVEMQLDNRNTTAGRHSGPLTRGSLYPLVLNGVDLRAWMSAAVLAEEEIQLALQMAAFLHGNGCESRDKVTLLLPRQWAGAGIWSKQDFEESLGKSEQIGIKIFPAETPRPACRWPVRHERQDRVFWAVQVAGCDGADPAMTKTLRQTGYPLAVLELSHPWALPKYMQWLHYVVFGMGWLRQMNFVTQPSVELYKRIAHQLFSQARKAGKVERTKEWRAQAKTRHRAAAPGGITLYYDSLLSTGLLAPVEMKPARDAADILAGAVGKLYAERKIEYAELTFYGDLRYGAAGRRLRTLLEHAADSVFGEPLALSADVYEGPAMNHSYHEMIIGHGRCFSIVLLARRQAALADLGYRSDYHQAQWLATKLALEQRGRPVVALTFPDLSPASLRALRRFFQQVGQKLSAGRI